MNANDGTKQTQAVDGCLVDRRCCALSRQQVAAVTMTLLTPKCDRTINEQTLRTPYVKSPRETKRPKDRTHTFSGKKGRRRRRCSQECACEK